MSLLQAMSQLLQAPYDVPFLVAAVFAAGVGAVYDIRERRIPNALTGPAMLCGLLLHGLVGGWPQTGSSLLAGLSAGALFLVFFIAGGMGAGDVKLMTAIGCLAGLHAVPDILIATVLTGAVYALVLAASRRSVLATLHNVVSLAAHHQQRGLAPHEDLQLANSRTLRLPYALPMAAGCALTLIVALRGR